MKKPSKTTFFVWDIVNEWTSGTRICPPIAVFPNFTLDAPSSVIYNLYDHMWVFENVLQVNVKNR